MSNRLRLLLGAYGPAVLVDLGPVVVHIMQPAVRMHFDLEGGEAQKSIVDWSVINLDSFLFSTALGIIIVLLLWFVASRATSGVPGRLQAAIEVLVDASGVACMAPMRVSGNARD